MIISIKSSSGQNELKRLLFSDNHEESIGNFKIKEIKDFTGNEYFPPLEENTVYNNLKIVYFKKVLGKEVNYREELEFKRIDSMTGNSGKEWRVCFKLKYKREKLR